MKFWLGRRREETEAALDKELRFHLEERAAAWRAEGLTESEARRRVRQEFGGLEQVREECRDVRPGEWLARLAREVRYAAREARKQPAATATVVLTVAICIAVNTAVFAVVDSVLLRPLPYAGADRLIAMINQYPNAGISDQDGSSAGDYVDRAGQMPAVAEHALYRPISLPVSRNETPVQTDGLSVTPSFFPLLRVRAAGGRLFTTEEAEIGKHQVAVLTAGLRRELFGDGEAVGQTVRISGQTYTVVGVLADGFRFVSPGIRFFVPIALNERDRRARHANNFRYIGRLREGATVEQAQAQVNALNVRLEEEQPELRELLRNAAFRTDVKEWQSWLVHRTKTNLKLLWAGAMLVLLAGAVNLAGLSLARAHTKGREMATRLALGATRRDLLRQSLLEGTAPALLGGVLGMAAGAALLPFADGILPLSGADIRPGWLVTAYALGGALAAGAFAGFIGLAPLRGMAIAGTLRDGARGGTQRGTAMRRAFVIAQVAVAFVLVAGAGLLTASVQALWQVNPGFRMDQVWTASAYLPAAGYGSVDGQRAALERATEAVRRVPGVTMAGGGSEPPYQKNYDDGVVMAEGYTMRPGESVISPVQLRVGPGYLETLGVAPLLGRLIEARDRRESERVIVIDEKLARRFWPGENPLGRRMYFPNSPGEERVWMTVVGVVRSIRLQDPSGEGNPNGVYYVPWDQSPRRGMSLVWRGREDSVAAVRRTLEQALPGSAVFHVYSMTERQQLTMVPREMAQQLTLGFAGVAVLLSTIGLHGFLAFLVAQRRREIGIRLAIGCQPGGIYRLFIQDGAVLVGIGLLLGMGAAAGLRQWVTASLYGMGATEPAVLAGGAVLLAFVSLAAVSVPAWRAARIDPAAVLGDS